MEDNINNKIYGVLQRVKREYDIKKNMQKTSECVTPKHPDKMCDRMSDAILDLCILKDKEARVAVEVMGGHGKVYVVGEISVDLEEREIKKIVKRICGIENVEVNLVKQSKDIAKKVDTGGAGDQGIMRGYACNENKMFLPQEHYLAKAMCMHLYSLFPVDGKVQITTQGDHIICVVASFCGVKKERLEEEIKKIWPNNYDLLCNPGEDWDIGGFDADTGLTGRKIVVDNYGPNIGIGGGCFSGKDLSKVDRSGALMARKIAKEIIIEGKYNEVYVDLAYAIGRKDPVMKVIFVIGNGKRVKRQCTLDADGMRKELKIENFEKLAEWGIV